MLHTYLASLLKNKDYSLGGNKAGPLLINYSSLHLGLYSVASITSIKKNNKTSSILDNTSKRYYSSSHKKDDVNFFEWFCGITDAEGSFGIGSSGKISKRIYFNFTFAISLHVDDISLLEFIKKRVGVGKVYIHGKKSSFIVKNKKDVKVIIDIFTKYPLKTHKNLNFLDFKKAFHLYTDTIGVGNNKELLKEIETIKGGMNTLRSEFDSSFLGYPVTSYWLLGFVEGEGSFFINKGDNYRLRFSIGQSIRDWPLMVEIQKFFNNLVVDGKPCVLVKHNDVILLHISQQDFIINKLIPLFDSMIWHSKKLLDYQDWKVILNLKELGLQYTEEGLGVIDQIINQMNNNRLSTSNSLKLDRVSLLSKIDSLLKGPSNLEEKEGKIFIKSLNRFRSDNKSIAIEIQDENGNFIDSFNSIADCIKY